MVRRVGARSALGLSIALILLMAVATGAGLLLENLYQDNLLVRLSWHGNDLVSLFLALPLLVISTILMQRRSHRGLLIWLGLLAYALYNYAFYLFGAAFNGLFLVYVAIVILATWGLIQGLTTPQIQTIGDQVHLGRAERAVGIFMILVSILLGLFWVTISLRYLWIQEPPAMVVAVGHPTNVTAALDLWLVVSFGLLGGIWLWQRQPWGYILATIWTVKGAVYMTALSAASLAAFRGGAVDDMAQLGLWIPIGLGCLVGSVLLLRVCPSQTLQPGAGDRWL